MSYPHKNGQKRIYGDYIYFITCNIQDRIEYYREETFCDLWIEELRLTKEMKQFSLLAFCLNYDHFHLLIEPKNDIANYSKVMQFFKRHVSRNLNIIMGHNPKDLENLLIEHDNVSAIPIVSSESVPPESVPPESVSPEGDIGQCRIRGERGERGKRGERGERMERPVRGDHHLLNEFDKTVLKYRKKYVEKHGCKICQPEFKWQKSFHDHIIRDEKDFEYHWNYTMYNFTKHNLPDDWKYTGLNFSDMIDDYDNIL